MGRRAAHALALALRGVAAAHLGADRHVGQLLHQQLVADARQRLFEVLLNVVGQRLEGRYVQYPRLVGQRAAQPFTDQVVDGGEKGRQGLARTGGGGDQGMAVTADRRPRLLLHLGGVTELPGEPGGDRGVKILQRHCAIIAQKRLSRPAGSGEWEALPLASPLVKSSTWEI